MCCLLWAFLGTSSTVIIVFLLVTRLQIFCVVSRACHHKNEMSKMLPVRPRAPVRIPRATRARIQPEFLRRRKHVLISRIPDGEWKRTAGSRAADGVARAFFSSSQLSIFLWWQDRETSNNNFTSAPLNNATITVLDMPTKAHRRQHKSF